MYLLLGKNNLEVLWTEPLYQNTYFQELSIFNKRVVILEYNYAMNIY